MSLTCVAGLRNTVTSILSTWPPGMPGFERYELYPYDIEKAKAMIAAADPADRQITVWTDNEPTQEEAGTYYAAVLEDIGFDVKLQVMNADNYFTIIGNASTPNLDTGWASWFQDYPHPNDFFQPLLSEESIFPTNTSNLSRIADPKLSNTPPSRRSMAEVKMRKSR